MASPTSDIIRLRGARLSFPRLAKPSAYQEGQEEKFQATFLLDPADNAQKAQIAEIKKAAGALMREAYGPDFKPGGLKGICFGDGNKKTDSNGDVRDGYQDMFYVTVSSTSRPAVANRKGEPVVDGDSQWPYAGSYVNATLTLWAQDNKFGKRINGNLRGVQFVKDGEAFGQGPVSVDSEFEALEDDGPMEGSSTDFDDDDIAF